MTDDRGPVVDFCYLESDELDADPWGFWDELRTRHPAFLSHRGVAAPTWTFTTYDAIYEGLRDYELFSSEMVEVCTPLGAHRWLPTELDPPEHTKYRQILTPSFSPDAVKRREPYIRERCRELIDSFADDGHVDVYGQFARHYPTRIFMEMMGLPVDRSEQLLAWIDDMIHPTGDDAADRQLAAWLQVHDLLIEGFDRRRDEPTDDLMSVLVHAELDGRRLTDAELTEYGFLLYMAGLDTVANAIGCIFHHFAGQPDQRHRLISDPGLVPSAVEELLRYHSVVTTGRVVTRDGEFHGCPLRKGDRALFPTAAADRDPAAFPDADTVVLDRSPNRHVAFGVGPHRCLGSNLARLELVVAIEEWHRRIPDYEVSDPASIITRGGALAGIRRLELVW